MANAVRDRDEGGSEIDEEDPDLFDDDGSSGSESQVQDYEAGISYDFEDFHSLQPLIESLATGVDALDLAAETLAALIDRPDERHHFIAALSASAATLVSIKIVVRGDDLRFVKQRKSIEQICKGFEELASAFSACQNIRTLYLTTSEDRYYLDGCVSAMIRQLQHLECITLDIWDFEDNDPTLLLACIPKLDNLKELTLLDSNHSSFHILCSELTNCTTLQRFCLGKPQEDWEQQPFLLEEPDIAALSSIFVMDRLEVLELVFCPPANRAASQAFLRALIGCSGLKKTRHH
jgi:hypothetical protein